MYRIELYFIALYCIVPALAARLTRYHILVSHLLVPENVMGDNNIQSQ